MPVVQPWHRHSILELDTPSSSAEGALLTKVMLIARPCLHPQAAAARGDVLALISTHSLEWGDSRGSFWGWMAEVTQWRCWRCGFVDTIVTFLLGCWVPWLARGDVAASPGCWQHQGFGCCPCMARVLSLARTWELRKDTEHRTPGRSHRTPGRSHRQRGPGGGIFLGLEHLVLIPAWCSSPPGSPGVADSHGAHTRG